MRKPDVYICENKDGARRSPSAVQLLHCQFLCFCNINSSFVAVVSGPVKNPEAHLLTSII